MIRYLRRFEADKGLLAVATVLLVVSGLIPGAIVWVLERVLQGVLAGRTDIGPALVGLVALAILQGVLHLGRAVLTRRLAWDLVHRLRLEVHARFHELRDQGAVGDRLAALTQEVDELQYGVSGLVTAIRAPISIVALTLGATWMAPQLVWRLLVPGPLMLAISVLGAWWVGRLATAWRGSRALLLAELTDQHNGLATTMDHGGLPVAMARMLPLSRIESAQRARLDWGKVVPTSLLQVGIVAAVAWLLWMGAGEVAAGRTTPGGLVAFAVALGLLRDPLVRLSEVGSLFSRSINALDRVLDVLERPVPPSQVHGDHFAVRLTGRVTADLSIAPGEKVAVVGKSGSGKSSLLAALAGRLPTDARQAEPFVLLRQDPWVFERTVRENLELVGPVDDAVLEALLGELELQALLFRLDEPVGSRGQGLSGGERQRLCLARALLTGHALLLDEATSEVEPALEERLSHSLAARPQTVVFATHSSAFPSRADRVIHLSGGEVVGQGTHAELLARSSDYRELWT